MDAVENANSGQNIVDYNQPFIKVKTGPNQETTHYSIFYEGIPEKFKLLAEKELNETEENKRECMKKLKEEFKGEFVEDALLLAFLRNKKFNLKQAAIKVRKFIAKRRELAKSLADMDMEKIETIIDDMGFVILPYRDDRGRVIVYTHPAGIHLDKYSMDEWALVSLLVVPMLMKYPLTSICGVAYLPDCKIEENAFYFYYRFLKACRNHYSTLFSFPLRAARLEVLNPIALARWVLKVVETVLSGKVIGRITVHNEGYDDLPKQFSREILPEPLGGTMGPYRNDHYKKKLLDFLREMRKEYS